MEKLDSAMQKAAVLTEALPYIQDFCGSTVLVKVGGSVMESEANLNSLLADIAFMDAVGTGARALRKALREADPAQLLSIKRGSGRKSRTADVEAQIFEELERNNYRTRQQVADRIEERFHIKLSVSAVGKLLKKWASKS